AGGAGGAGGRGAALPRGRRARGAGRPGRGAPPPRAKGASEPRARPPERSPDFTRLVQLRAYSIWHRGGRPTGAAGEAVKEKNWLQAGRQIGDEGDARAHPIWEKQGRPAGGAREAGPEGERPAAPAPPLPGARAERRPH